MNGRINPTSQPDFPFQTIYRRCLLGITRSDKALALDNDDDDEEVRDCLAFNASNRIGDWMEPFITVLLFLFVCSFVRFFSASIRSNPIQLNCGFVVSLVHSLNHRAVGGQASSVIGSILLWSTINDFVFMIPIGEPQFSGVMDRSRRNKSYQRAKSWR